MMTWKEKLRRNIGPVEEDILRDKEFFFVLDRGIIQDDENGEHFLKYYPSDDDDSTELLSLDLVKTQPSENDDKLKYHLIRFAAFRAANGLLGTLIILLLYKHLPQLNTIFGFQFDEPLQTASVIAAFFAFYFLVSDQFFHAMFTEMDRDISNNFTNMTNQWANAISALLGNDIKARIYGIRRCMLEFRRFIKWRRFGSISSVIYRWVFAPLLTTYIALYISIFAISGVSSSMLADINRGNFVLPIIVCSIAIFYLLYSTWRVHRVKLFLVKTIELRTAYRDPTVQLAVMASEMHQKYVQRKMA